MEKPTHPGFSRVHRQLLATVAGMALVFTVGAALVMDHAEQRRGEEVRRHFEKLVEKQSNEYKNAVGSYLSARLAATEGDVGSALTHLGETMAWQRDNKELMTQAYRLSVLAGNFEQAGLYAEKLGKTKGEYLLNPDMLELVLAIKRGQFAKAQEKLPSLKAKGAGALFMPVLEGWIALGLHQQPDVRKLQESIKFSGQFEPLLLYQAALLFDAAGLREQADAAYAIVAEKAELSYRMAIALAGHYERSGETAKLQALKEKYQQEYGHSFGESSEKQLASTPREGAAEIFYGVASVLFGLEAFSEAEVPLKLALYLRPDFDAVMLLQANLLEQQERYDEAYLAYEKLRNHPAFGLQAGIRMAYCLQEADKAEEALALLKELQVRYAQEPDPVLTIADILRVQKRYREAVEYYNQALELLDDKKARQWPVLYARGICYERMDEWAKAEADFLEALRREPNQPDVLNYLGYSWLIQNKHLQQAREMIEKAMVARPQDAHIIDSMGWAMYQLGRYEDALDYLEQAIDLTPRDPTVNEHLGDVYWRLGYKLQAKYQWERALFFGPEEPGQKKELKNKLSNGLPPLELKKSEMLSQNSASGVAPEKLTK